MLTTSSRLPFPVLANLHRKTIVDSASCPRCDVPYDFFFDMVFDMRSLTALAGWLTPPTTLWGCFPHSSSLSPSCSGWAESRHCGSILHGHHHDVRSPLPSTPTSDHGWISSFYGSTEYIGLNKHHGFQLRHSFISNHYLEYCAWFLHMDYTVKRLSKKGCCQVLAVIPILPPWCSHVMDTIVFDWSNIFRWGRS